MGSNKVTKTTRVDNTAYDASTWDSVHANSNNLIAPSKNAVRDKIETIESTKYTTSAYSTTLIKVLPHEFRSNDDRGNDQYVCIEDGVGGNDSPIGAICGHSVVEAYAFVKIPSGFKATHVNVHASASTARAVEVYDYNYTDGVRATAYTTGAGQFPFNTNTTLDTEVVSSTTKDLLIKVFPADNTTLLFGATVTIVAV